MFAALPGPILSLSMEHLARECSEEEDFYKLLRCDQTSAVEQISTEFKLLARKYHPDKVSDPDAKDASEKRFVLLKRARDVLLDSETRRMYDQWRAGFKNWISFQDWLKMQGRVHSSIHWGRAGRHVPSLEQGGGDGDRGGGVSCEGVRREEGEMRPPSEALHQFRNSRGGGSSHSNKFRNYQI